MPQIGTRQFKQVSAVEQAVVDVNNVLTHEVSAHRNTNSSSKLFVKELEKKRTTWFLCIWSRVICQCAVAMAKCKCKIEYPCSICEKSCGDQTILCSSCRLWCHRKCIPLTEEKFTEYASTEDYFVCPSCAKDPGGEIDWDRSLQRYVFGLYCSRNVACIHAYYELRICSYSIDTATDSCTQTGYEQRLLCYSFSITPSDIVLLTRPLIPT